MRILNIDVPEDLLARWREFLAPEWQPFFVQPDDGFTTPPIAPDITPWAASGGQTLSDDLRDTFKAWRVQGASRVVWFDEASFMAMPRSDRARLVRSQVDRRRGVVPTVRRWAGRLDVAVLRRQADGHRFVWWPSLLAQDPEPVLVDLVEDGQLPSRHQEVPASTWNACRDLLPHAEEIVGTFPLSSGPNCFGTVLAAAGKADASEWVLQDPFEHWLQTSCVRGGDDNHPGTVLVWRDRERLPVHAAVTIGDGWAMEKPAQTWWTVRGVHQLRDLIKVNRSKGQRLERHRIVDGV
jgi:hypothetical protein